VHVFVGNGVSVEENVSVIDKVELSDNDWVSVGVMVDEGENVFVSLTVGE
jgi:hypothetical protein